MAFCPRCRSREVLFGQIYAFSRRHSRKVVIHHLQLRIYLLYIFGVLALNFGRVIHNIADVKRRTARA